MFYNHRSGRGSRSPSRKCEFGSTLVEFALIFPILTLMSIGVADFGRAFYGGIVITNAANAGVEYGSRSKSAAADTAGMIAAAQNDAQGITGVTATAQRYCECPNGSSVSCTSGSCTGTKRTYVSVTTGYTFNTLMRYPRIPSSIIMSRKSVMRAR